MKKLPLILFTAIILQMVFVKAQSVTDSVRFDTYLSAGNNDLVNNFSNTSWVNMITSGGITGGALMPPDSISWGNNLISYCKNYVVSADSLVETSICFKYNSSLVQPSSFQRAVDIWLFSDVVNHWVIYSVNYNQRLTILSYSSATDTLLSLTSGHWYKLVASYKSLSTSPGDWAYNKAEVFDLGTSGLSVPVSVGHETVTYQDFDLVHSAHLEAKVSGARKGGGELLDDFTYHGVPGTNTCSLVGIQPLFSGKKAFTIYPQPAKDKVTIQSNTLAGNKIQALKLFNAVGQQILALENIHLPYDLSLSSFPGGIYFLEVTGDGKIFRNKICKE